MNFQVFHVNWGKKLKKKDVNNDLSHFMSVFPNDEITIYFDQNKTIKSKSITSVYCTRHIGSKRRLYIYDLYVYLWYKIILDRKVIKNLPNKQLLPIIRIIMINIIKIKKHI